jgi:hypothetical protein
MRTSTEWRFTMALRIATVSFRYPVFGGTIADLIDEGGEKLRSDPYAGVFFSKDRSEKIIESKAKPVFVNVLKPLGVAGEGAVTRRAEKVSVKILGSGEWMSGCPEAGKLSCLQVSLE